MTDREVGLVEHLQKRLRERTKADVIRPTLRLLQETTDRAELRLRRTFRKASLVTLKEIEELDALKPEGLEG